MGDIKGDTRSVDNGSCSSYSDSLRPCSTSCSGHTGNAKS